MNSTIKSLDPSGNLRMIGEKIEYIYRITEKINSTHDLNVIARDIVQIMIDALDCIGGALFIVDEKKNTLNPFAHSEIGLFVEKVLPLLPKPFQDYAFDLNETQNYTVKSVAEQKMMIDNHYDKYLTPFISKLISKLIQKVVGMKTIVTIPTIIMGKAIGVLMVGFREKELGEEKQKLLKIFSNQCAIAIRNAQEYQKLQAQYLRMKEILAQQSDFIAVTAHELRTPLSIAVFQLDEIVHSEDIPKKYLKELKIVENSLDNLKELTEKLFTVQQYDLKKVSLNLENIEINTFLKQIHADFLPIIRQKHQKFDFYAAQEKKFVNIDPIQIRQVIHNLIKNANKFTPEHGSISLEVEADSNWIYIWVKDNGQGIPDDLKKNIFEKFRTKLSEAGIGLGLYLSKKTIELHGGKIWVEDNKPRGSAFCVQLQAEKS